MLVWCVLKDIRPCRILEDTFPLAYAIYPFPLKMDMGYIQYNLLYYRKWNDTCSHWAKLVSWNSVREDKQIMSRNQNATLNWRWRWCPCFYI